MKLAQGLAKVAFVLRVRAFGRLLLGASRLLLRLATFLLLVVERPEDVPGRSSRHSRREFHASSRRRLAFRGVTRVQHLRARLRRLEFRLERREAAAERRQLLLHHREREPRGALEVRKFRREREELFVSALEVRHEIM